MKSILIYTDKGTCPLSVKCLLNSLSQLSKYYQLKTIDSQFLSIQEWESDASLLIMPGGRDVPYHQELKGNPNKKIQNFVRNGGAYLGLCAGAYYACSTIEFEKGHPLEIVEKRELSFFPGIAQGPAYGAGKFAYNSSSGALIAPLMLSTSEHSSAYFNGGCLFTPTTESITILAKYEDLPKQPPAIIYTQFGNGNVVLSGVHPEFTSSGLPLSHPFKSKLASLEAEHQKLFKWLLSFLL